MKSKMATPSLWGRLFGPDLKTNSFWLTLLALAFITVFGHYDTFDYPNSSHLSNIRTVIESANKGFYFQYVPGVAMESAWDDFFMAFTMSSLALVGNVTGIGKVGDWTIYVVQFFLLAAVFLLPFWKRLFTLPAWFYPVVPAFLLAVTLKGILFYSWAPYWAQTVAAFWIGTVVVHLWQVVRKYSTEIRWRPLIAGHLAMGLVAGTLGLIRYNSALEARVVFAVFVFMLIAAALPFGARRAAGWRKPIFLGIILLSLQVGVFAPPKIMAATWWVRDQIYEIQPLSRFPQHPLWYPIYLGLGYVENSYGIKWDDGIGFEHAKARVPGVKYGTPELDLALRDTFFAVIKEQPSLLVRSIGAKTITVSQQMGVAMIALYLLYLAWLWRRDDRWAAFGGGLAIGAAAATPIIAAPYFYWNLGLHGSLFFWGIYSLAALVSLPKAKVMGCVVWGRLAKAKKEATWASPKTLGMALAPVLVFLIALFPVYILLNKMDLTKSKVASVTAEFQWSSEPVKKIGAVKKWQRVPFTLKADGQFNDYGFQLPEEANSASLTRLKFGPFNHLYDFQIKHIDFKAQDGKSLRRESIADNATLSDKWTFSDVAILDSTVQPPILGRPSTSASPLTIVSPPRYSTGELFVEPKFELPPGTTEVSIKIRILPRQSTNFFQWVKSLVRLYLFGR